jgi:ribosomal protein S18 acetylase RimI-like enzyme
LKRVAEESELSLEFLPFDTNLFGVKCGKVSFGAADFLKDGAANLIFHAKKERYRHIVAKVPGEWVHAGEFLREAGFSFIVESIELKKDVLAGRELPENIFVYTEGENDRLVALTREAFSGKTRFHLDGTFPPEKATQLHERWIVNLVNDPNIVVLVHRVDGIIEGYITINCQNSGAQKGHIGLFAVDRKFSGRGIGSRLLESIESLDEFDLTTLWAMTESINQSAIKTYTANQFRPIKRWNVFRWKPQ